MHSSPLHSAQREAEKPYVEEQKQRAVALAQEIKALSTAAEQKQRELEIAKRASSEAQDRLVRALRVCVRAVVPCRIGLCQ